MLESEIFIIGDNRLTPDQVKGLGKKKLFVICRKSDYTTSEETLKAILKAIQYDMDEDCFLVLLNDPDQLLDINPILSSLGISHLLVFGINPKVFGYNIQARLYHPLLFEKLTFILSHSISDMASNKQYKVALWQTLQNVFLKP